MNKEAETERVFEIHESFLPSECERCKLKRPRSVLIKRMLGKPMSLAFLCNGCAMVFKSQASHMAEQIRARMADLGAEVD